MAYRVKSRKGIAVNDVHQLEIESCGSSSIIEVEVSEI